MRKTLAGMVASLLLLGYLGTIGTSPATAEDISFTFTAEDFYIPRPVEASDQEGEYRLLTTYDLIANGYEDLIGLNCRFNVLAGNEESIHLNNFGVLATNGQESTILHTEDEPFVLQTRLTDAYLVLGSTINLYNIMLRDDNGTIATSVDYEVHVTCPTDDQETTTTSTPTTSEDSSTTTTTEVSTTTTDETTSTTEPITSTTSSSTSSTVPPTSSTSSTSTTVPTETTTTFPTTSTTIQEPLPSIDCEDNRVVVRDLSPGIWKVLQNGVVTDTLYVGEEDTATVRLVPGTTRLWINGPAQSPVVSIDCDWPVTTTMPPPNSSTSLPWTGPPIEFVSATIAGMAMLLLGAGIVFAVREDT